MTAATRYTKTAIVLHWLMALLIIAQLIGGYVMADVLSASTLKFDMYQWHKAFGLTILLLALLRLLWRLTHRPPPLAPGMAAWERMAAHFTHIGFYGLMIGVPLLGWLMVSASESGLATSWFGLFTVPDLPVTDSKPASDLFETWHAWLAYGFAALLVLHVGAALKHHFVARDGTLTRMLPFLRPRS